MIAVRDNTEAKGKSEESDASDSEDEMQTAILEINSKLDVIRHKNIRFFKGYDEVVLRNHELEKRCKDLEKIIRNMHS